MKTVLVTVAALVLLSGCTPTPLVIADLESDKVVIQADAQESHAAILDKAREGCAIHGRTPIPISTQEKCGSLSCYGSGGYTYCGRTDCWKEHLFACR